MRINIAQSHNFLSVFKSTRMNLAGGSENCFVISSWKLLLNNMHTPALELEAQLKIAEKPYSADHRCSFPLWCNGLLEEIIFQVFFILSQRKVPRLFKVLERPLTFREQIMNSSIGN